MKRRTLFGRAFLVALLAAALFAVAPSTNAGARSSAQSLEALDPAPPQYPFVCTTAREGLGQPKVDNQDQQGIPVAEEDAEGNYPSDSRGYPTQDATIIGWSKDCEIDPVVEYRYRDSQGEVRSFEDPTRIPEELPADIGETTTSDGQSVPYIIRWERGTVNRFLYSAAMLAPATETDPNSPDDSLWNGRLLYHFDGGVAIGHTQGRLSTSSALDPQGLDLGYAVVFSSGTRTNTHYNMKLGGETAVQVKDTFVQSHGEPIYTVGVGGSGGAIQQYLYGQNHPDLLDGGVAQYSYPDMVTQTIHVGDCELLEHYFDVTAAENPLWDDVEARQLIEGMNAEREPANQSSSAVEQWSLLYGLYGAIGARPPATAPGAPTPGLTECRSAWFGLTPLTLNPTYTNVDDIDKLAEGTDGVEWTHWADAQGVYGVGPDGYALVPWDNVGVQYGLEALANGDISEQDFVDINAQVGTWKESSDMVAPGCPFEISLCLDASEIDPWSSRQMRLSPDDGATPAPRREGSIEAMNGAYNAGHVFTGEIEIPIIDWRHYLEAELDMHNSSQSFASRQRLIEGRGNADNQVIWWTDGRPEASFDQTPEALEVMHDWIMNIQANPESSIGDNRPAKAVDSCFDTDGSLLFAGEDAYDGMLNDEPLGECLELMPTYSTARRAAGAPVTGSIFKCYTKSVKSAVLDGTYGEFSPYHGFVERMEEIFASGVCDYSRGDVGNPDVVESPRADTVWFRVMTPSGELKEWRGEVDSGDLKVRIGADGKVERMWGNVVMTGSEGSAFVWVYSRQGGQNSAQHEMSFAIRGVDRADAWRGNLAPAVVGSYGDGAAGLVEASDGSYVGFGFVNQ